MNIKTNLKRIWSAVAVLALALLIYRWFGEIESTNLLNTILALNVGLFILALPCSLFGAAVVFAAWYFLEMNPATDGIYLSTIVLLILGALQWFWLIRFYYPPETPFQKLNLTEA